MVSIWRKALVAAVFSLGFLAGVEGTSIDSSRGLFISAQAQGAYPNYKAPLGLHRECRRKIRVAYRAPGCTRRCYPRNFYRQRMDYCIQTGGSV